jgi:hypothetical protein
MVNVPGSAGTTVAADVGDPGALCGGREVLVELGDVVEVLAGDEAAGALAQPAARSPTRAAAATEGSARMSAESRSA